MKTPNLVRRRLLTAATALPLTTSAFARPFSPGHPVRVLFPWSAGGELDGIVRQVLEALTRQMGSQFVMEYKPGGTTMLAASSLTNARPDGHTLMIGSSSTFVIN